VIYQLHFLLARQRLLDNVANKQLSNPVFLTGDWHSTFVNDLNENFADPSSRTIATEFVTPAISSAVMARSMALTMPR
jgi:alkaline phosphatase D